MSYTLTFGLSYADATRDMFAELVDWPAEAEEITKQLTTIQTAASPQLVCAARN